MTSTPHLRAVQPADLAPPAARYAHAIESTGATRWLHTSGVVPTAPDGSVLGALPDQAAQVWRNLSAMLADADMGAGDVVSVTTYVVPGQDLGAVMAARDAFLGEHRAASTLVVVAELAQPAWLVEVALVACR
ncbi:RidA family protein [Litorihabitans aurantiacus]|uniref:Enamine deaminase RidA n=1 Tax=Litorihabitans aurantiacus TaxID=1930061 RepID=A0AA37UV52_9MICO|nr:Rid family hydrolase [Litorihabitans aurantiacus]GMA31026.1 enamine deaminase RidA [Litorihabitans aurantiacus]